MIFFKQNENVENFDNFEMFQILTIWTILNCHQGFLKCGFQSKNIMDQRTSEYCLSEVNVDFSSCHMTRKQPISLSITLWTCELVITALQMWILILFHVLWSGINQSTWDITVVIYESIHFFCNHDAIIFSGHQPKMPMFSRVYINTWFGIGVCVKMLIGVDFQHFCLIYIILVDFLYISSSWSKYEIHFLANKEKT